MATFLESNITKLNADGTDGIIINFNKKEIKIGSHLICDVILENSLNVHCVIEADAFGRVTIVNHDKKPIFVNGNRIFKRRPLPNNSIIDINNSKFRWYIQNDHHNNMQSKTPQKLCIKQTPRSAPSKMENKAIMKKHKKLKKDRYTVGRLLTEIPSSTRTTTTNENTKNYLNDITDDDEDDVNADDADDDNENDPENNVNSEINLKENRLSKTLTTTTTTMSTDDIPAIRNSLKTFNKLNISGPLFVTCSPKSIIKKTMLTPTPRKNDNNNVLSEIQFTQTPKKCTNMYLIDLSTPPINIEKQKQQSIKKTNTLLKSAIKNAALKTPKTNTLRTRYNLLNTTTSGGGGGGGDGGRDSTSTKSTPIKRVSPSLYSTNATTPIINNKRNIFNNSATAASVVTTPKEKLNNFAVASSSASLVLQGIEKIVSSSKKITTPLKIDGIDRLPTTNTEKNTITEKIVEQQINDQVNKGVIEVEQEEEEEEEVEKEIEEDDVDKEEVEKEIEEDDVDEEEVEKEIEADDVDKEEVEKEIEEDDVDKEEVGKEIEEDDVDKEEVEKEEVEEEEEEEKEEEEEDNLNFESCKNSISKTFEENLNETTTVVGIDEDAENIDSNDDDDDDDADKIADTHMKHLKFNKLNISGVHILNKTFELTDDETDYTESNHDPSTNDNEDTLTPLLKQSPSINNDSSLIYLTSNESSISYQSKQISETLIKYTPKVTPRKSFRSINNDVLSNTITPTTPTRPTITPRRKLITVNDIKMEHDIILIDDKSDNIIDVSDDDVNDDNNKSSHQLSDILEEITDCDDNKKKKLSFDFLNEFDKLKCDSINNNNNNNNNDDKNKEKLKTPIPTPRKVNNSIVNQYSSETPMLSVSGVNNIENKQPPNHSLNTSTPKRKLNDLSTFNFSNNMLRSIFTTPIPSTTIAASTNTIIDSVQTITNDEIIDDTINDVEKFDNESLSSSSSSSSSSILELRDIYQSVDEDVLSPPFEIHESVKKSRVNKLQSKNLSSPMAEKHTTETIYESYSHKLSVIDGTANVADDNDNVEENNYQQSIENYEIFSSLKEQQQRKQQQQQQHISVLQNDKSIKSYDMLSTIFTTPQKLQTNITNAESYDEEQSTNDVSVKILQEIGNKNESPLFVHTKMATKTPGKTPMKTQMKTPMKTPAKTPMKTPAKTTPSLKELQILNLENIHNISAIKPRKSLHTLSSTLTSNENENIEPATALITDTSIGIPRKILSGNLNQSIIDNIKLPENTLSEVEDVENECNKTSLLSSSSFTENENDAQTLIENSVTVTTRKSLRNNLNQSKRLLSQNNEQEIDEEKSLSISSLSSPTNENENNDPILKNNSLSVTPRKSVRSNFNKSINDNVIQLSNIKMPEKDGAEETVEEKEEQEIEKNRENLLKTPSRLRSSVRLSKSKEIDCNACSDFNRSYSISKMGGVGGYRLNHTLPTVVSTIDSPIIKSSNLRRICPKSSTDDGLTTNDHINLEYHGKTTLEDILEIGEKLPNENNEEADDENVDKSLDKKEGDARQQASPNNDLRVLNEFDDLRGVRELMNTPQQNELNDLRGVRELMNTPHRNELNDMRGVRELMNTPPQHELNDLRGVKELLNTPARDEFSDLIGVKELVKTPFIKTLNKNKFNELCGVKELMKTPKLKNVNQSVTDIGYIFDDEPSTSQQPNKQAAQNHDIDEEEYESDEQQDDHSEDAEPSKSNEIISLDDTFNMLIGKPIIKSTYTRKHVSPNKLLIDTSKNSTKVSDIEVPTPTPSTAAIRKRRLYSKVTDESSILSNSQKNISSVNGTATSTVHDKVSESTEIFEEHFDFTSPRTLTENINKSLKKRNKPLMFREDNQGGVISNNKISLTSTPIEKPAKRKRTNKQLPIINDAEAEECADKINERQQEEQPVRKSKRTRGLEPQQNVEWDSAETTENNSKQQSATKRPQTRRVQFLNATKIENVSNTSKSETTDKNYNNKKLPNKPVAKRKRIKKNELHVEEHQNIKDDEDVVLPPPPLKKNKRTVRTNKKQSAIEDVEIVVDDIVKEQKIDDDKQQIKTNNNDDVFEDIKPQKKRGRPRKTPTEPSANGNNEKETSSSKLITTTTTKQTITKTDDNSLEKSKKQKMLRRRSKSLNELVGPITTPKTEDLSLKNIKLTNLNTIIEQQQTNADYKSVDNKKKRTVKQKNTKSKTNTSTDSNLLSISTNILSVNLIDLNQSKLSTPAAATSPAVATATPTPDRQPARRILRTRSQSILIYNEIPKKSKVTRNKRKEKDTVVVAAAAAAPAGGGSSDVIKNTPENVQTKIIRNTRGTKATPTSTTSTVDQVKNTNKLKRSYADESKNCDEEDDTTPTKRMRHSEDGSKEQNKSDNSVNKNEKLSTPARRPRASRATKKTNKKVQYAELSSTEPEPPPPPTITNVQTKTKTSSPIATRATRSTRKR